MYLACFKLTEFVEIRNQVTQNRSSFSMIISLVGKMLHVYDKHFNVLLKTTKQKYNHQCSEAVYMDKFENQMETTCTCEFGNFHH